MTEFQKSASLDLTYMSYLYLQISQIVKENSINLIFAVTAEQTQLYQRLVHHIEGSSCGMLSGDSGNVVELVKEQYEVSEKMSIAMW